VNNILITYLEENNITTKIEILSNVLKFPINIYFVVNDTILWETKLESSNTWCSFPNSRGVDIRIIDNNGDLILNNPWTFNSKSDICEIEFIKWCQEFKFNYGSNPNGIVIGSHNGSSGEWVESYNQNLIGKTLLIEPNIKPFNQLVSKYQSDTNFKFKKVVVSDSNDYVDFYTNENSDSESSSLIKNNLLKNSKTSINHKIKSISPNVLLNNFPCDWLHIDAEGYDAKIILMIDDIHLSKIKFIIWEHIHLDEETKLQLKEKLISMNFKVNVGFNYNTYAIK
jgi:FkbM family methyltransferase